MFARKSTTLFSMLNQHHLAGRTVMAIKWTQDDRYESQVNDSEELRNAISHDGITYPCMAVDKLSDLQVPAGIEVIGIDEGQFFGDELPQFCDDQATQHHRVVIVAALDTTYTREPWPHVSVAVAQAEEHVKLAAICVLCGEKANYTKRITTVNGDTTTDIAIGGADDYVAVCRAHHEKKLSDADLRPYRVRVNNMPSLKDRN